MKAGFETLIVAPVLAYQALSTSEALLFQCASSCGLAFPRPVPVKHHDAHRHSSCSKMLVTGVNVLGSVCLCSSEIMLSLKKNLVLHKGTSPNISSPNRRLRCGKTEFFSSQHAPYRVTQINRFQGRLNYDPIQLTQSN